MGTKKLASSPYVLWSAIFIVLPMLLVCYFAFVSFDGNFTLENFKQAFKYGPVIANSIWLSIVATTICLIIAYPFAFLISRKEKKKQTFYLLLLMLPMWLNFLIRTYAWMTLLENNGLINQFLGIFGIGPFEMINTQGAVVLGMVYNYLPFMILPIYSVMTKIDRSVIDAASDLGCNRNQIFQHVIFPLSIPGISTGIIMVFVPSVSTFAISRMLGGGSFMLIGDLIEMQFLGNTYNINLGSAISIVLMVIILLCMALTNLFQDVESKEGMLL
ncbi:MAG: ABC transporter permease [Anaerovoracaceae bacterium]